MYTQPTDQPVNPTTAQPATGFDPNATAAYDPSALGTTVYPNAAYGTYPATAAPVERTNRGLAVVVGVLVALLFLGGGVAARQVLSSSSTTAVAASPSAKPVLPAAGPGSTVAPSTTVAEPEVPVTTAPAAPSAPSAPAPKSGGNGGGAPQPTNPPAPPTPPVAPKPAITSFTTPETIDCHNGNFQEFTASWTTTNATKVSISIDGPGVYKYYPATGSDSLPFTCSTPHSFMLTAYGADGSTVSTTITLQPRNVQTPQAPGADDE